MATAGRGDSQGCPGSGAGGPATLTPASPNSRPLRRRQTGRPWRRRCGACGTTTGGCRPSRRVRPPACSWPPSSWAPWPPTWPEPSGRPQPGCPFAGTARLLRAPGPHKLGPPQELSLREARLSTAPLPGPLFGDTVALTPPICKYSVEKRGLQGIKKPLLFVSTQVFTT